MLTTYLGNGCHGDENKLSHSSNICYTFVDVCHAHIKQGPYGIHFMETWHLKLFLVG